MKNIDDKQLFTLMRNSVHKLSRAAIRGREYAHDNGIVIALERDFLITAINKLEDANSGEADNNDSDKPLSPFEMVGEFDENDGETFEMMASTCEAIRNLAEAYGGDSHFNNCVLMGLRSCISALEGLNK